jgi:integration host factor subunit beta
MTRSQFIARLAARYPQLTVNDVELAVNLIFGAVTNKLVKGERAEFRGFGTFDVRRRPARTGRNPKSGKVVEVPEKPVVYFRAGAELRKRVNSGRRSHTARPSPAQHENGPRENVSVKTLNGLQIRGVR